MNNSIFALMRNRIHICFILYTYNEQLSEGEDLLSFFHSLTGWAKAISEQGCKVSTLIRFHKNAFIEDGNIEYYFHSDTFKGKLKPWQIPTSLHKKAKSINADVYHCHNMDKVLQHTHLKYIIGNKKKIVIQNHAETPKKWLRIFLQRLFYKKINAFLFCAKGQDLAWRKENIITSSARVFFVMEASTYFEHKNKLDVRQKTHLNGDPVFLWVGNLNANKDPLTILAAFNALLQENPNAQLYMIYRLDNLLAEVKEYIDQRQNLQTNVHLLGSKPRNELENYYNSADYFILGSHHEGSGYSLMEAMACGCIPIVTDIYSFKMMTNEGQLAYLWKTGEKTDLQRAMRQALLNDKNISPKQIRQFFEHQLSYKAIGEQMLVHYKYLLTK